MWGGKDGQNQLRVVDVFFGSVKNWTGVQDRSNKIVCCTIRVLVKEREILL